MSGKTWFSLGMLALPAFFGGGLGLGDSGVWLRVIFQLFPDVVAPVVRVCDFSTRELFGVAIVPSECPWRFLALSLFPRGGFGLCGAMHLCLTMSSMVDDGGWLQVVLDYILPFFPVFFCLLKVMQFCRLFWAAVVL